MAYSRWSDSNFYVYHVAQRHPVKHKFQERVCIDCEHSFTYAEVTKERERVLAEAAPAELRTDLSEILDRFVASIDEDWITTRRRAR